MHQIERTLIAIKPESIQLGLTGEFITKFENKGLKLIAAKLVVPTKAQIEQHYPDDEAWYISSGTRTYENYKAKGIDPGMTPIELAKKTRRLLIEHLSDRPLLAMIWEGANAIAMGRKTAGSTNPVTADIGSIRGDYSLDSYELSDALERSLLTLVHASGSVEEAEHEIKIWFKE